MHAPIKAGEAESKHAVIVNHYRTEAAAERCRKFLFDNIRWNHAPLEIYYFKDDSWGDDFPIYKVVVRSRSHLSDYGMTNLRRRIIDALSVSFK